MDDDLSLCPAERFGIAQARQTVGKILQRHGVKLRRMVPPPEQSNEAARSSVLGCSLARIGPRTEAGPDPMRLRLSERGGRDRYQR